MVEKVNILGGHLYQNNEQADGSKPGIKNIHLMNFFYSFLPLIYRFFLLILKFAVLQKILIKLTRDEDSFLIRVLEIDRCYSQP